MYWYPWLGHFFGLAPSDIGSMTYEQLEACRKMVEKRNSA